MGNAPDLRRVAFPPSIAVLRIFRHPEGKIDGNGGKRSSGTQIHGTWIVAVLGTLMLRISIITSLAVASLACAASAAPTGPSQSVRGYFCGSKPEQVSYLHYLAAGDTEEIAANKVNKVAGKQTCAYFLPAQAIPTGDQTLTHDGMVLNVQSFVFLPEKVERWTGSLSGAVRQNAKFSEL